MSLTVNMATTNKAMKARSPVRVYFSLQDDDNAKIICKVRSNRNPSYRGGVNLSHLRWLRTTVVWLLQHCLWLPIKDVAVSQLLATN